MKRLCADPALIIRDFTASDAAALAAAERAQGWNDTTPKHLARIADRDAGRCLILAAEYSGEPVGYVSVYTNPDSDPFAGTGWCEIVDFNVIEKFRRRGIGTRLLDAAEATAAEYAPGVYLGVGLHSGYGSAQRMYFRRGYRPDGSGAWYGNSPAEPYKSYPLDDDLIIYLSKSLPRVHRMKLKPSPFAKILFGSKTIELRLNDEKRRRINIGDTLIFTDTETRAELAAEVTALHPFADFTELYSALPPEKFGYSAEAAGSAKPSDMDSYYSPEQQRLCGVLGIGIKLK